MNVLVQLYNVIQERKTTPLPGSYTNYLLEQGLDKTLKKCAEECGEVIIAAKNGDNSAATEEICDLLYHLLVMMAQQDISLEEVERVLEGRRAKIANRKPQNTRGEL